SASTKRAFPNELHHLSCRPRRHRHGHPVVHRPRLSRSGGDGHMTIDAPGGIAVVETTTSTNGRESAGYVDWAAIFAGIVFASAISLVLISFGSAIGLNFVDFDSRQD